MVIAMLVSMGLFGAVVSMLFPAFGHSSLLHYTALTRAAHGHVRGCLGMALWMRYRHQSWTSTIEMSAAMLLPYIVRIGPFAARQIGKTAFLASMHALMVSLMIVAMLRRRTDYSEAHRLHRVMAM